MTIKFDRPPPRAAPIGKNGLSDHRDDFATHGRWSESDVKPCAGDFSSRPSRHWTIPGSARKRDPSCSIGSVATTSHRFRSRPAVSRKASMRMLYVTCWRLDPT